MNEMNVLNLNGTQYEIADKKARQNMASVVAVTMIGTAVSTDMVSPVEHDVECKISGVPDLSAVTVSRYGKNLFGGNAESNAQFYGHFYISPDGALTSNASVNTFLIPVSPGTIYGKSYNRGSVFGGIYNFYKADKLTKISTVTWGYGHPEFTNTVPREACFMMVAIGKAENEKAYIGFLTAPKDFPEFEEPITFTPSADGTVTGMKSISPNMTILTDNPEATITATYNADTKRYIDSKFTELQALALDLKGGM